MFFGTYFHQKDTKNRIRIPSRFSKELGTSYVIGRSCLDDTLVIYTNKDFERISAKTHSPFNKKAEQAYTKYFGSFFQVNEDSQGRLQLTDPIIKLVDLGKDIVFVGAQDHINLMSKEQYDRINAEMDDEEMLDILNQEYEKSLNQN